MKPILNKKRNLGLFVLVTIACIFIVINFLRGSDIFSGRNRYYKTFSSVDGLSATSPIYIRGLKVGSIETIKYDNIKDLFVIRMAIKSDYAIPANSKAELYSADILGSKSVRISFGTSNIHLSKNDTLQGIIVPDMISTLTGEFAPLKEQFSAVMENLNKTLTSINAVLDSTTQKNLSETFSNLNATASNAKELTTQLNEMAPQAKALVANLSELSETLKANKGTIEESLNNIKGFTGNIAKAPIEETIEKLNSLISQLQSPDGTVGKLLNSNSIYNNVDSLIFHIDDLIQKITANPKKYIKISVF